MSKHLEGAPCEMKCVQQYQNLIHENPEIEMEKTKLGTKKIYQKKEPVTNDRAKNIVFRLGNAQKKLDHLAAAKN